LQQDYLTAKAKLPFFEQEFNRQKELNQSKASSDKLLQQSQADYTSQKILVNALFQKLQLIGINPSGLNENNISRSVNLYSPIDGFISEVNVNIGKYVNPSDILFEIVDPSDIDIVVNVFEKDVNRLVIGQKVIAYTNINPEKKYSAEIFLIGKELSQDRNVEVYCHFHPYDKALLPGMFMNAEIEVQTINAGVLPEDAVVSFENKKYVFVAKGKNDFEMMEVKTGNTNDGYIEIISGNTAPFENLTFVTKGAYNLLMKIKNTSEE
jgi:cobalt-zinc-cadmium efflux system membrane fusion protein